MLNCSARNCNTYCSCVLLQVNIGSGVSMLLVHSREKIERVGGTSLGGRCVAVVVNWVNKSWYWISASRVSPWWVPPHFPYRSLSVALLPKPWVMRILYACMFLMFQMSSRGFLDASFSAHRSQKLFWRCHRILSVCILMIATLYIMVAVLSSVWRMLLQVVRG